MFAKVLVANRGEIAVRAFRAATEMGATTVAVFPYEDRGSEHRLKADEAYEIGERGHPVRAYLDPELIVRTAVRVGADAVYPGYGFLSENPQLAEACAAAGITFVGPTSEVLELTGNKARAIAAAKAAGVPTLRSVEPNDDVDALVAATSELRYPLFVKAVAGGGGRGMRRVDEESDLREAIEICMREGEGAFGDSTVFVEEAVTDPRHIEVQVLADAEGNVIHLFERDCSVQRRHQKVVEIAPAPNLPAELRDRMCADAVRFAREIGYRNAGTVEFLLDPDGSYVFIEMNPRIQVEHTVTEEVTDVDLVQSQMRIASGETLADLGLSPGHGVAARRRAPVPDHHRGPGQRVPPRHRQDHDVPLPRRCGRSPRRRYDVHRCRDLRALRLDAGQAHLPRLVVRQGGATRAAGAGGVPDPRRLHEHRVPRGAAQRAGLRGRPAHDELHRPAPAAAQRARQRRPRHPAAELAGRGHRQPAARRGAGLDRPGQQAAPLERRGAGAGRHPPAAAGAGARGVRPALREQTAVAVTDTTFRDAHQSLLATRVRTRDLITVSGHVARLTPELWSLEAWGGATYDVALRFLTEDPWERLARLRQAVPNICLQMLLRGRNTVGLHAVPDGSDERVRAGGGRDRHRRVPDLRRAQRRRADAARDRGGARHRHLGGRGRALLHRRPVQPRRDALHARLLPRAGRPDRRRRRARARDQGHGRAAACPAARTLVTALRERFDLPVHLHTHDTPGGQLATLLAAIDAGVDAVDACTASMAGTTSQPALSALVATTDHSERETGLDLDAVCSLEPYWEATRRVYAPFESGLPSPTGRVYTHEIPGGQLSNLRQQAIALGLGEKFEQIEDMYAAANDILGNVVKVTPSSKVVGDLALHLVAVGADPAEFEEDPAAVRHPRLGGRFPQRRAGRPARRLAGAVPHQGARGPQLEAAGRRGHRRAGRGSGARRRATLNELLFPGPTREFHETRERYGDISVLPTTPYLYGLRADEELEVEIAEGKTLLLGLQSISEPDERGFRTVMCTINGQLRPVNVRDKSVPSEVAAQEKADTSKPGQVAAPFDGVVTLQVGAGDKVEKGATVATIEAMKMEASITAPVAGTVERLAFEGTQQVEGGDLVLVVG